MNKKFYNITAALLIVVSTCCGLLAVGAAIVYAIRPIISAPPYSPPTRLPSVTRVAPVKTPTLFNTPVPVDTPMPTRTQTPKPAQAPSQTAMIVSHTVTPSPVTVLSSPTTVATLATATTLWPTSTPRPTDTTAPIWVPSLTSTPRLTPTLNSATATLPPAPAFCICNAGDTLNCSDFSTWAEAQACFLKCGGVANDVYRLDGNNNGVACEEQQY